MCVQKFFVGWWICGFVLWHLDVSVKNISLVACRYPLNPGFVHNKNQPLKSVVSPSRAQVASDQSETQSVCPQHYRG